MSLLSRRKAPRPSDGSMTLREHLYELRHRLFFAVLAIFLGAVIGFIWFTVGIPRLHIPPLVDILTEPYCSVPATERIQLAGHTCSLLATDVWSPLNLRISSALIAGAVLSCPIWLYQIWAFVGPALYSKEKRFALTFVAVASALFVGGMVLAYSVLPEAMKVLLGFGGNQVVAGLDPGHYFKFLVGMMLIFGVSLELPLLLVMLNYAGVIKGAKLAHIRRYAFFGLVVFAALVVPGNDPVSMGTLALTLCVLYEAAVQVTKSHDRRKAKAEARSYAELPDDVASPLEPGDLSAAGGSGSGGPSSGASAAEDVAASGDIGSPEPVGRPSAVAGPSANPWADSGDAT